MMYALRKENDSHVQGDREIKEYMKKRWRTLVLSREYCVSVCVDFKRGLDKRKDWWGTKQSRSKRKVKNCG